jgi:transglutaminase/protease-like cytokinesis protein 3
LRVKALHDWVADRIAYDAPAYTAGTYPPQDAETVFRTRTAVCAGYARLMVELGRAIDEEIVYVVGDARVRDSVSGEPHAWNAVRIDGDWYLMDVTWDAGHLDGSGRFVKRYETTSFLTPPEVFGLDHLPDEPEWQLRAQPLGRGEFNRQPMLRAAFFAVGLRLIEPARSQIDVDGRVKLVIDNPRGRFLLGKFRSRGGSGADGACGVRNGRRAEILCAFPRPGAWEVSLYDGPVMYGTYTGVGSIDVNSR